ncbi:MAG: AAA family ATPase [Microbacterium sp.]
MTGRAPIRVILAVADADRLAAELEADGAEVLAALPPDRLRPALRDADSRVREALDGADALVVPAARDVLTAEVVSACDRHGVRILPVAARPGESRWARSFGLGDPLPPDAEGWRVVDAAMAGIADRRAPVDGPIVAVWGTHGAPGRSTVAAELAVELARLGGRAALVDADTHAPSLATALGLAEDSPGIAAACRKAEAGLLDAAELTRISAPLASAAVDVLTGLNRPSRWPELSADRVAGALRACRGWVDHTVVDTAASIERDEEIVSDLDGPRRNAAALAALGEADRVVAVVAGDPVGIARFLRAHAELRAHVGSTPVHVVVNRVRAGALGVDARGQIRRTLSRYAALDDVSFVPYDRRAADGALLAAQPAGEIVPRSPLSQGVRRLARVVARHGAAAETAGTAGEAPTSRRALRRSAA